MDFSALKNDLRQVIFETMRMDCDNYFEAVVLKDELAKLVSRLEQFFGIPVLPAKGALSFQMQEAVKGFGGIMPGQVLYFREGAGQVVFAMLWPWQDGRRTTVKIVQQ